MRFWGVVRLAVVAAIVVLSAMNASWIAPQPPGVLRLIATQTAEEYGCIRAGAAQKAFVDGADYLLVLPLDTPGCLTAEVLMRQMPKRKFLVAGASGIRATAPSDWVWTLDGGTVCFDDYFKLGWLGIVPASCRGKTMLIPLEQQWKVWGWPKRFQARMNAANVRVILLGRQDVFTTIGPFVGHGISSVTELPDVPRDFTGYLWVEDIAKIGPAIRR